MLKNHSIVKETLYVENHCIVERFVALLKHNIAEK